MKYAIKADFKSHHVRCWFSKEADDLWLSTNLASPIKKKNVVLYSSKEEAIKKAKTLITDDIKYLFIECMVTEKRSYVYNRDRN